MLRSALFLTVVLAATVASAQKVTVPIPKPAVGQEATYAARIDFQVMGQEAVFTSKVRRAVKAVAVDGSYDVETSSTESKFLIGSDEQTQDDNTDTIKIGKDGFPVERKPHDSEIEEVLNLFGRVRLPAEGVEIGGSWEPGKFWPDERYGAATFTLVGKKDVGGRECWEIKVDYACVDGSGTATGASWVEAKTGLPVGFEATFADVAVGPGVTTGGKISLTLVSANGF